MGEESVDEARDAREDVAQRGPRVEAVDAPLGVRERERVDARPAPPEGPARQRPLACLLVSYRPLEVAASGYGISQGRTLPLPFLPRAEPWR